MTSSPILIAVAPNGARKGKHDNAALPITPLELAQTAVACAEAGAGMIHLHVRDAKGNHTLEPAAYRPAIKEIEAAVGDRMLIQVSSEAAGIYDAPRQIELMKQLAPHCISCGLREFVPDDSKLEIGADFFVELDNSGTLIQYILYSPEDVRWYEKLCRLGVIPGSKHLLLFVLGRCETMQSHPNQLDDYVMALKRKSNWMVCAFGEQENLVMRRAAECGGHARIGFENNLQLPSGAPAPDNAALVKITVQSARLAGRMCGGKDFAEALF
jgi:3-keto-5-aminohexanoate cleavage enzyme